MKIFIPTALLLIVSIASSASDLLQVSRQALLNNPNLNQSAAQRDAAREKISQARSALLPQIGLSVDYGYNKGLRDSHGVNTRTTAGSLGVTQTLFDMSKWHALSLQQKTAALEEVSYRIAEQKLIEQTASAYFDILSKRDKLNYVKAHKRAVRLQLDNATLRFSAGLATFADTENARAQYDRILADEVSANNDQENALEALRSLTGHYYSQLATLDEKQFTVANSDAISVLLREAETKNLSLLQARLNQTLAREQVRLAQDGHLPTLSLSATTNLGETNYSGSKTQYYERSNTGESHVSVKFSLPLYQGNQVHSQVRQAQLGFVSSGEKLESEHRRVAGELRTSYNNVRAAISSITAYGQALKSSRSSLEAMKASYSAGTRTLSDVLDALSVSYESEVKLSEARYAYLVNFLKVRLALGSDGRDELITINGHLGEPATFTQS